MQPQISLTDTDRVFLVLVTQDPLAINRVGRSLTAFHQQEAAIRLEIASLLLQQTRQVMAALDDSTDNIDDVLKQVDAILTSAEQLERSRDHLHSLQATDRATGMLRHVRRQTWERAAHAFPSTASSPLCSSFATLPLHREAARRFADGTWSDNALVAGDCEDLATMLRSGWRQQRGKAATAETFAELSPLDRAGGRRSLHVVSHDTDRAGAATPDWPLRITSAPVAVKAGQIVRVHGWIKVPRRIGGDGDGLMIFDSLAGPELADRVLQTEGWREFSLYRTAMEEGDLVITFALTGAGEAWLDNVSVNLLK